MAWPAENLQIPERLKNLIVEKKCVLLIGSGLSAGSYDSWPDLINALCCKCGSQHRVTRDSPTAAFLDAAQDAKDTDELAYYSFLGEHFGRPAERASLLYDALLSLPFECYLTVNLDPLLALKARTAKLECSLPPHPYPSLYCKFAVNRTVHYLHGMIREGEIPARGPVVLARKEFKDAYRDGSNLMNFLVPTLENETMVFVGCRLKEPVMPEVFKICKEHQLERKRVAAEHGCTTSAPPARFILLPKPVVDDKDGKFNEEQSKTEMEEQDAYYRQMEIKPVWYVANGSDHSALRIAFEKLANLPDVTPHYGWNGGLNGN